MGDVLFGSVNPAGRAGVTSYLSTSDLPEMGNTNLYPNNGSNGEAVPYETGEGGARCSQGKVCCSNLTMCHWLQVSILFTCKCCLNNACCQTLP